MSKRNEAERGSAEPGAVNSEVVNWDPPSKRDLVERALSDGMTDPAKIVEWARNHRVTLTDEEVRKIQAELKK